MEQSELHVFQDDSPKLVSSIYEADGMFLILWEMGMLSILMEVFEDTAYKSLRERQAESCARPGVEDPLRVLAGYRQSCSE